MLKNNIDELKKGDWCFGKNDNWITIQYDNDNFKDVVVIPISKEIKGCWNWNEDKNNPTITPSILVHPYKGWTNGWHGYLTDGKLITV